MVIKMNKIAENIYDLMGCTPMLHMGRIEGKLGAGAKILAKLEYFNPAGSIKDRVALNMIERAEESGALTAGAVIIEPTSGNTGIGLACVAAAKGYRTIFTMPETMSVERRKLLTAYGGEIVLTPGGEGMKGAITKAAELKEEIDGGFIPGQFENPANPEAHYLSTGPEIWEQTEGTVDILVSAIGTGGTITGIGKYLKEKNPSIKVIGVEPASSPFITKGYSGPHKIQGIGAGFIPSILELAVADEVIAVTDESAMETARAIAAVEGALVGISSGAAMWAAVEISKRPENTGKNIVVILPDTGERYLSGELFE